MSRDEWPIKLSVRGEQRAQWVRSYLERSNTPFQFEALPLDDYQFRVERHNRASLRDARHFATAPPESRSQTEVSLEDKGK